jgi:hypothetical protein
MRSPKILKENDLKNDVIANIDSVIQEKVLRDKSPEAKAGRRRAAIRAACHRCFRISEEGTLLAIDLFLNSL